MMTSTAEKFYRETLGKMDKLLSEDIQKRIKKYVGTKYNKQIGTMLFMSSLLALSYFDILKAVKDEKDEVQYWDTLSAANSVLGEVGMFTWKYHTDDDTNSYIG